MSRLRLAQGCQHIHPALKPHVYRRFASTGPAPRRPRIISTTVLLGSTLAIAALYYDTRSILHEHIVMPLIRYTLDPEAGHHAAVRFLSLPKWARPRDRGVDGEELQAEVFGLSVNNPVGMAAGFDKDAEAIDGLFDLGFGYVEIGSVTPEPQPGNPQPRFFRLEEDSAAINRYGFNSLGHGHTLSQLRSRLYQFSQSHPEHFPNPLPLHLSPPPSLPRSLRPGHILAVNLGKNKTSPPESNTDYIKGVRTLGPYADILVINVSSPNTPGLRALQGREILEGLLREVVEEKNKIMVGGLPKVAVKVACDLSEEELGDVAVAVTRSGVDGVIVSNTTIRREGLGLHSDHQHQIGGLSGKPLFPLALHAVQTLRPLLPPKTPIIACGGISTGLDAIEMAKSGASLIQLYTSFGYRGVGTPRLLKDEISGELGRLGKSWKGVIGERKRDWGREEERLRKAGEDLRIEGEGLGRLLRGLEGREETLRLVKEAEAALGAGGHGGKEELVIDGGEAGVTEVEGPRDNLLGASGEPQGVDPEQSLLEDALAQQVVQSATDGQQQRVLDLLPSRGPSTQVREEADPWTTQVQSGQRRLV